MSAVMRRRRRKRIKSFLDEPCYAWPDCICGDNCRHWHEMLARWNAGPEVPEREWLEWARESIIFTLACISHNCPDPWKRREARLELMHPIFFTEWMRISRACDPDRLH
jgi:hypothetical protein